MKLAQWFADANFIGPAELPTLIKVSTTAPGMDREEVQRIAHLVAAAPALLEALQWALGQIEDDMDPDHQAAMAGAHAAINRAIWGQK